jgi:translation elongation factor EF-Ts
MTTTVNRISTRVFNWNDEKFKKWFSEKDFVADHDRIVDVVKRVKKELAFMRMNKSNSAFTTGLGFSKELIERYSSRIAMVQEKLAS